MLLLLLHDFFLFFIQIKIIKESRHSKHPQICFLPIFASKWLAPRINEAYTSFLRLLKAYFNYSDVPMLKKDKGNCWKYNTTFADV